MGAYIIENGKKVSVWFCAVHMTMQRRGKHEDCPLCMDEFKRKEKAEQAVKDDAEYQEQGFKQ